MERVTVLSYATNQGKGHALKTGLHHMIDAGFDGAVTADSDGQHTTGDILNIIRALEKNPGKLILGMRDVAQMPPKSKSGNSLTRVLFRLLYGIRLQDTQTGLRGIPLDKTARSVADLPGERYEYEMEMLIESPRLFPNGLLEVPIKTVYLDNNEGSHFRPIRDGMKIYSVLFRKIPRFLGTSLLAFCLDYGLFNILYYAVFHKTVYATVIARLVSGNTNYMMNRHLVFGDGGKAYTLLNYWKLAIGLLLVNTGLMFVFVDCLKLPAFIVKVAVEMLMYAVSFVVQNRLASERH